MGNKEYKTSEEVKQRAEEAIGHTFKEIFELDRKYQQENGLKEKHGKGDIGQAYEEGWFNYTCNEEAEPDFKDADVELKVTPFLINSRGYRAKERLSLGKINYRDENWNEYEESRFWTKNHHLLVMYYQYIRNVKRPAIRKLDCWNESLMEIAIVNSAVNSIVVSIIAITAIRFLILEARRLRTAMVRTQARFFTCIIMPHLLSLSQSVHPRYG